MSWRLAKALEKLRSQINALEPTRDKTSDGTIGDAAHQKTKSEHNPNEFGVVTAFDCTHDPIDGVDCNILCAALVASRDARILYVIWNKQMYRSYPKPGIAPWTPSTYTGKNAHEKHLHISLIDDADGVDALYDDMRPWALPADLSSGTATTAPSKTLRQGMVDAGVLWVRERLRVYRVPVEGTGTVFDKDLERAVTEFQKLRGLRQDGVVGPDTRGALAAAPVAAPIPVPPTVAVPTPQPVPTPSQPSPVPPASPGAPPSTGVGTGAGIGLGGAAVAIASGVDWRIVVGIGAALALTAVFAYFLHFRKK